ncbi:hypothetical protein TNCV_2687721 [Trichonephila clavipes]|nr:hypothetical protein TNCV_2687721 [Trichonephila clavipes]
MTESQNVPPTSYGINRDSLEVQFSRNDDGKDTDRKMEIVMPHSTYRLRRVMPRISNIPEKNTQTTIELQPAHGSFEFDTIFSASCAYVFERATLRHFNKVCTRSASPAGKDITFQACCRFAFAGGEATPSIRYR